jgi:hypothetical protein
LRRVRGAALRNVYQLVRQQPPARPSLRLKPTAVEYDVAADGVSNRVDGLGRFRSTHIRVNANRAEVLSQTRFHQRSVAVVQGIAGAAQHVVHNGWHRRPNTLIRRGPMQALLLALGARAI